MALFFVGGIYGAGKSDLCKSLSGPLNARHVTASELIQYRPPTGDPTGKAVTDIESNQRRLVAALSMIASTSVNLILDGHFTLLKDDGKIGRVPLETFIAINPQALILVAISPSEANARLNKRDPGSALGLPLLAQLAQEEEEYAKYVSSYLNRPLKVLNGRNPSNQALAFLRQFVPDK